MADTRETRPPSGRHGIHRNPRVSAPPWWPGYATGEATTRPAGLRGIRRSAEAFNTLSGVDEVEHPGFEEHVAGADGIARHPARARLP